MELASNWYRTRAHYSRDLKDQRHDAGREGPSLCSTEHNPVWVYDKDAHEAHERKYFLKPKPIESLPICKKCAKTAAKAAPGEAA